MSEIEHHTLRSYIIGFVLSLVFTLIPYYLVVEKSITGNVLLGTILGFAVLQLLVQVIFFLHLGREKNPRWQTGFLVAAVGAVFVVVGGSLWITSHLNHNMHPADMKQLLVDDEAIHEVGGQQTGSCRHEGTHTKHRVIIKDGLASPGRIEAELCDTLTFINEDDTVREITFGPHPNHGMYAGNIGKDVSNRRGWTITLSQPGAHQFHDHLDERINGVFVVTP
jgi:cytochrome o ubiquinol oxidase subunit IV